MGEQRHIINRQLLEMHLPNDVNVQDVQRDIGRMYREKFVPIINRLCDRHSPVGTQCKIDTLTIDLGVVPLQNLHKLEAVFAEKLAAALKEMPVTEIPSGNAGQEAQTSPRSPVEVLAYYLTTGMIPWWAEVASKKEMERLLEALCQNPPSAFTDLLKQLPQRPLLLDRFIHTFSSEQLARACQLMATLPSDYLPTLHQEVTEGVRTHGQWFGERLTLAQASHAFWSAAFRHLSGGTQSAEVTAQIVMDVWHTLGANLSIALKEIDQHPAFPATRKGMDLKHNLVVAIYEQVDKLAQQHVNNDLWQTSFRELSAALRHTSFSRLPVQTVQDLKNRLQEVSKNQNTLTSEARRGHPNAVHTMTEEILAPLTQHLRLLKQNHRPLDTPVPDILSTLSNTFNDTDFISVPNAGQVILWPFLSRFFENLGLLNDRKFVDASAQSKAVAALQYLVDDEQEAFEGMLTLHKILCGMPLEEPLVLEPLTPEDQAMGNALLQAVIARGPHWKNLSPAGFRTSYLQREGVLRSRDGHWLLQVKKETFDITLERLPWSFNTIKLPWMNEILLVEWM